MDISMIILNEPEYLVPQGCTDAQRSAVARMIIAHLFESFGSDNVDSQMVLILCTHVVHKYPGLHDGQSYFGVVSSTLFLHYMFHVLTFFSFSYFLKGQTLS
jgi:hypothetical protein